jgi:hypothetical protein
MRSGRSKTIAIDVNYSAMSAIDVQECECTPIWVGGGCKIYDVHKLMKSEKMMMILASVVLQIEICIISSADDSHNVSAVCKGCAQK